MQLVTLRYISTFRGSCTCCGQDHPYLVNADDNCTRTNGNYCFRCFQYLNEVTLVESNRALT